MATTVSPQTSTVVPIKDNFFELKESPVMKDRLLFTTFIDLLTHVFNIPLIEKDSVYRYSMKMETESNHKFILDNWDVICLFGHRAEYLKKAKRLVHSTISHIVTNLNELYKFNHPVTFVYGLKKMRLPEDKTRFTTITYHDLIL